MKTFKSFITEAEELTPQNIKTILRDVYKFKSAYKLENNAVVTTTYIALDGYKNEKLPILIQSCREFIIKNSRVTSTYGFPKDCARIYMNMCNDIVIGDFANTNQGSKNNKGSLEIEECYTLKHIKNLHGVHLDYILCNKLHALKKLHIKQCSTDMQVVISECSKIKLSDISIGNKISSIGFNNAEKFINFVGCTIAAEQGVFGCQYLKTFDGFDTLKIDACNLDDVNCKTRNLSALMSSPNTINKFDFSSSVTDEQYQKMRNLREVIVKYIYKNNKADYIMDFTVEVIDAGFDDQV